MLPFTREAFLDVFSAYNDAVWPAQPIAYALGAVALVAAVRGGDGWQRIALAILGAMWMWTGLAYHWLFFAEINSAAIAFGIIFVLQGMMFTAIALAPRLRLRFRWRADPRAIVGAILIGYAFLLYPLIDFVMGSWPRMPAFGISPCPVTLFTLGLLLLAAPRPAIGFWVIPLVWSLIGGTAAFLLGIVQDWVLLLAGPAALLVAFFPSRSESPRPIG